jgi:hypothetical protein
LLQAFLSACANISKVLWPDTAHRRSESAAMTQARIDRAKDLPALVGVLETSPLRERDLRNFFEHFDERLDQVAVSQPSGAVLMARNVLPPGSIGFGPGMTPVYLGNLDDNTMTMSYRDHKGQDQALPLLPLLDAVKDLTPRVESLALAPPTP